MAGDALVIGLVNNMPDAALRATERQFRELLAAASGGVAVRLRLFCLPDLPRAPTGQAYLDAHYEDIGVLWHDRLDGLIVTGTEPRAPRLPDEPYWRSLTRLIDWAEQHTASTIWSCLAAHAAVLHCDGIERRRLDRKLVGVFDCVTASDHEILSGMPERRPVPHSRCNDLPAEALLASGYRLLSWSQEVGPDLFARQRDSRRDSLFLFLQGHPEYDAGALYREYRRDVARFLAGERDRYPEMPRRYFDDDSAAALIAFRERALAQGDIGRLAAFPAVAQARLRHTWREPARHFYANWLSYLKAQRSDGRRAELSLHRQPSSAH